MTFMALTWAIPIVATLMTNQGTSTMIDDCIKMMKKDLLSSMKSRLSFCQSTELYSVAKLLDPRYCMGYCHFLSYIFYILIRQEGNISGDIYALCCSMPMKPIPFVHQRSCSSLHTHTLRNTKRNMNTSTIKTLTLNQIMRNGKTNEKVLCNLNFLLVFSWSISIPLIGTKSIF